MHSPQQQPRSPKKRLDSLVVERGLSQSREKAQALILAGQVLVNGQKALKAGQPVPSEAHIEVLERMPYVSRGGYKLAAALDAFEFDPAGRICLDVGSSTGGFTDVLLQRDAKCVYAVDVGHGQLDWKLRNHPRVIVREGINARYLDPAHFPDAFDLAVCDVSFISATYVIPSMVPLLAPGGAMIILVKPQFEVEKGQVGKGGIVRDPELHNAACDRVRMAVEAEGFDAEIIPSPILGAEGNREFLLFANRRAKPVQSKSAQRGEHEAGKHDKDG